MRFTSSAFTIPGMMIPEAVAQLNQRLPLRDRQAKLSDSYRQTHRAILYSLVKQGRALTRAELAAQLGSDAVEDFLQHVAMVDLVVLDAQAKTIAGAYPLTTEKTPHAIEVNGQHLFAMCALDAVAVAPLFAAEVVINSRCHVTRTPLRIHMRESTILLATPVPTIYVGVRWQQPNGHAAHSLCMEMVFLRDGQTASQWQGGDQLNYSVFTLQDAVEFGARYFKPLLVP